MTGAACRAGNAYPSGAPDFTSDFHMLSCCLVSIYFLLKTTGLQIQGCLNTRQKQC